MPREIVKSYVRMTPVSGPDVYGLVFVQLCSPQGNPSVIGLFVRNGGSKGVVRVPKVLKPFVVI